MGNYNGTNGKKTLRITTSIKNFMKFLTVYTVTQHLAGCNALIWLRKQLPGRWRTDHVAISVYYAVHYSNLTRAPPLGVWQHVGPLLFKINFFKILHARIFKAKVSLGSMQEYCNTTILLILYTGYWVSQVCITDLMHTRSPVQTQILE